MNRKQHIAIYYVIPLMVFLTLVSLSFALAPPPVDQRMGVYDTLFANLTEFKCRNCHTSGGTIYDPANVTKSTDSVPDRHHLLVPIGKYVCMNCHPVITYPNGSQAVTIVRDCMQCHDTTFNGMTIRRPHHETLDAQQRYCSRCHGNLVDDYNDGHYIPTYDISLVTPDTKYKVINATTGKKWGGCEACHEQNLIMEPPIAFNNKTHHRLGSLSGFNPPNSSKCVQCHDLHNATYGSDSVRYCERCHATKSLHNIQYDYANTSGSLGSGHIGANWDCNGCHAWYVAGDVAPGTDVIIPTIETLSISKVIEGTSTVITISGKDFVTTVGGVTHSSEIVIANETSFTTLTPSSISSSEMVVTIPSLSRGAYGIYALKNGNVKSNKLPLVSVPNVIVKSAVKSSSVITITGSGFGTYDPLYKNWINVTIKKGTTSRNITITSWSDTLIKVTSADSATGDTATVNSINGYNSTRVKNK